jgi:hypothetical protein
MRGRRPLGAKNRLRFDYHVTGGPFVAALVDTKTGVRREQSLGSPKQNEWANAAVDFEALVVRNGSEPPMADEIHFLPTDKEAVLTIDDVLLYEPGE